MQQRPVKSVVNSKLPGERRKWNEVKREEALIVFMVLDQPAVVLQVRALVLL